MKDNRWIKKALFEISVIRIWLYWCSSHELINPRGFECSKIPTLE